MGGTQTIFSGYSRILRGYFSGFNQQELTTVISL